MAALAVIKGRDGSAVTISEMRMSFAEWSSTSQAIAQCTCGWTEKHILVPPLVTSATVHVREEHDAPAQ